jgi:hypothetical protein
LGECGEDGLGGQVRIFMASPTATEGLLIYFLPVDENKLITLVRPDFMASNSTAYMRCYSTAYDTVLFHRI